MSASLYENFKSAFGYYSPSVVEDKKRKVDGVLTRLEKAMTGLQETTKTVQMAYHPGKAGNAEEYKSMRERFTNIATQRLAPDAAYTAYDAIEQQANKARATVFALQEANKRMDRVRKMTPDAIDKIVDYIKTDIMVGAPGGLNGDQERGVLIAAIKVRYDIDELAGDLPHDVLLRFYHVLSLVPKNHTKDNPKLKIIKRSSMDDISWYYQDGSGTIAINGGEVGGGLFSSARDTYTDGAGKVMKLDRFDAHTLHEVGHAVDDACGFMALHSKKADFGGWKTSSYAEAMDVGVKRIKDKFSSMSPVALAGLLQQAMMNKTFDEAIQDWKRRSGNMGQVDRQTLLADAAVQAADGIVRETLENKRLPLSEADLMIFSDALRLANFIPLSKLRGPQLEVIKNFIISMKDRIRRAADMADEIAAAADALKDEQALSKAWGDLSDWGKAITKRLWWAGSGKIGQVSFANRVYFADNDKWWSYDIGARGTMVRDYQFRSPSEWFAEVYAVEMLGKLSDGHPCKGMIRGLDSTKQLTE